MLDTELEVIAHLDDFEELQCEHPWHNFDMRHNGAATHWAASPCGHADGYRCGAWVKSFTDPLETCRCITCGLDYFARDLKFTPTS